jgi:16S rRNA (cytosine967-C5)-methyltransferase
MARPHGEPTAPRRAALEVMRAVRGGDLADRALERVAGALPAREHGWVKELVYGTLRLRGRLDHLLEQRVKGGLSTLQPVVHDVLRLGAYQLLEMGSVPPYAAISQSVDLVRTGGAPRAAGLVNGVLNTLQRERERLSFPPEDDAFAHLTRWGSHPEWLVHRWLERLGAEDARRLVEANNTRPELFIRLIGTGRDEAIERLAAHGIGATPVALSPDSLRVEPPATAAEALAHVPAVVQDPAASLVVRFAAVAPGWRVIDLCAAPGGKAAGLAGDGAYVAAADLSLRRLGRLRENVERLALGGAVGPVQADGRWPPFRPVDAVLLDAPCTGTGTFRRHPDGRWRVDAEQLAALVRLQRELLAAAARLVRPGGVLLYSTCSLEPEENEERVHEFLAANPGFRNEPVPDVVSSPLVSEHGFLNVLPQRHGFDGAFAARLRRSA